MRIPVKLKKTLLVVGGLMLITGIMATAAWFILPGYVEHRLIPGIMKKIGGPDIIIPLRRIGLFGADVGPVRIGGATSQSITIPSIHLDYAPAGLLRKRLNAVRLAGMDLSGSWEDGKFTIEGLDPALFSTAETGSTPASGESRPIDPPIHIDRVELSNTIVHFSWHQRRWHIPIDITISPDPGDETRFDVRLVTIILGDELRVDAKVRLDDNAVSLSLDADNLTIDSLIGLFNPDQTVLGHAAVRVTGSVEANLSPFQLTALRLQATSADLNLLAGNLRIGPILGVDDITQPMTVSAGLSSAGTWQVALRNISIKGRTAPQLRVIALETEIQTSGADVELSGSLTVTVSGFPATADLPFALADDYAMDAGFSGGMDADGGWRFNLKSRATPEEQTPALMHASAAEISIHTPMVHIDASGDQTGADAKIAMQIPGIKMSSPGVKVDSPSPKITGDITADFTEIPFRPRFNLSLTAGQTSAATNQSADHEPVKIGIPVLNLSAAGQLNPLTATGDITISGARVTAPAYEVGIAGIMADIPVQWPFPEKGRTGTVKITDIRYGSWDLGSVAVQLSQTETGFTFQGNHKNPTLPALGVQFSGDSHLMPPETPGARIQLLVRRPPGAPEIDLSRFSKNAAGIFIKGGTEIDGRFLVTDKGMSGEICSIVSDGRIRIPGQDITVDGLRVNLCMPEIPVVRSAPQQQLSFDNIKVGELQILDGTIDYQVEALESILVEKGKIKWCDGTIRIGTMRIRPDKKTYDIRLDCDRLNLAKILGQFGVAQAEGSGTVNGTIPIRFHEGKITFDDGFLYSTPGIGGKIRLAGTQSLTAGIPEGTVQFFQIDLAREALKDFDYQWTKLGLNTKDDELVMRLQFDGKPAKKLPFEYKQELGGFIRVDAEGRGSNFQGISLDVNFRIPLDDLLQYKDILKQLE
ncbi:MAG: hypothetical protein HKM93_12080 [Desulfobacteraceae bacterium]|nr:hypothetical protein [Desulfobacteraceae bacterium]